VKRKSMFDWQNLQGIYTSILAEVNEGKNLSKHLSDVEQAIADLDKIIIAGRNAGHVTAALEKVKNDFYYLKYCILEKT
jgi:type II secretory pathway component PulF